MKGYVFLLVIISFVSTQAALAQCNTAPTPQGDVSCCGGVYTQPSVACAQYTDEAVFCHTGYGMCCDTRYTTAGVEQEPNCGDWAHHSPQLVSDGKLVLASLPSGHSPESCKPRMLPVAAFKELSESGEPLHVVSKQSIDLPGVVVGRVACDASGNFYAYLSDNEVPASYRLAKISPSGAVLQQRDVAAHIPGTRISAFSVLPDGAVYMVGITPSASGKLFVIVLAKDGRVSSRIELQSKPFAPSQLVAFPSGELLVSGSRNTKPVTQLFDLHGNLLRDIYEAEDEELYQRAETGELSATADRWGNKAVWRGDAALGSDGNAYLLRAVSPALIYVISHHGAIVRKVRIQSPLPGLAPYSLRVAPGRLAVSFVGEGTTLGLIRLTSDSGKDIEIYSSDEPGAYPGLPGCYNGSSFSFLSRPDDKEIVITTAK